MTLGERLDKVPVGLRKWIVGAFGLIVFGGTIVGIFLYFYLTSRLSYPERNVLYRTNETVTQYASSSYHNDRSSIASISEGSLIGGESMQAGESDVRVKAIMCTSKRREKGDIDEYELLNMTYQKVAQASTKSEKSRAIFDISRSNYIQNVAGFIDPRAATEEIKLITLETAPEIARSVDADTYVIDEASQKPVWRYRLTDGRRYFGLLGDRYRYSTRQYEQEGDRSKLIFHSSETGLFGIMPQGSNFYMFKEIPGYIESAVNYFSGVKDTSEVYAFKISQYWDAFPWRILNGGYVLSDSKGAIAKIAFEDFWFNYADDCVYWYYLDLNGDGKIDDTTEVIGKVLFSKTESKAASEAGAKDASYTINYSFMAGYNMKNAMNEFVLCGDIEAMMPDQIFDGFGQHSYLGLVEEKRDDIMLYLDKTVENLDRAIKEDDTLGFKTSILRMLLYAKRPYVSELAKKLSEKAVPAVNSVPAPPPAASGTR